MRHDTSSEIYLKMLQKGYFEEIRDECIIDCAAHKQVDELKLKFMSKFNSIEEFLVSSESVDYDEDFKYIASFKFYDY